MTDPAAPATDPQFRGAHQSGSPIEGSVEDRFESVPPNRTKNNRTQNPIWWSSWSRAQPLVTSNLFLGLVLAVLAWPASTQSLVVTSGLSPAWQAAVTMAAHHHLAFGSRVVFTYGPLGFLVSPNLFFVSTSVLAFVFALAFLTALYSTVVWALRRTIPLPLAVVVAYLVGGISLLSSIQVSGQNVAVEDVLALVLIVCVFILTRREGGRVPVWIWLGMGGSLGILSLVKLSLGLGLAVIELITVAFLPTARRRAVGALALGAVPLFCVGWFGTGNGFQNLVAFGSSSVTIIGGYGAAMSFEQLGRGYPYWLAAFALALIGAFAVAHSWRLPRRSQIGVGLVTLATLWFLFKEGFVRHDVHDLVFFVAAPLVLAAFSPSVRWQAWLVAGMFALTMIAASVSGVVPELVTQPVQAARNFFHEATTLTSGHQRERVIALSRKSLTKELQFPNQMVSLIRGETVDVGPWEDTIIWAHPAFHFDPLPVLQDYNAYTPSLDQLDVSFLRSSHAPRYMLRQPVAIDTRNPAFEPPATQLAIECRYREVAATSIWELLEHQTNRCGHPQHLRTVTTGLDHWVTVPSAPAGDEVAARFQLANSSWSEIELFLFKPPPVSLTINGGQTTWRFIAATGPDLHVLRASSALGYSSAYVPVPTRNLRFSINGEGKSKSGIKISFYEVPMAAASGGH